MDGILGQHHSKYESGVGYMSSACLHYGFINVQLYDSMNAVQCNFPQLAHFGVGNFWSQSTLLTVLSGLSAKNQKKKHDENFSRKQYFSPFLA